MNTYDLELINYYSNQSCITNPGEYSPLFEDLPSDISELVNIVQGLILHLHWTSKYGVSPSKARKREADARFVSKQLELINKYEAAALNNKRPVDKRILGICRDYSVFLTSMLRHLGIPARARCGFGTYFTPGQYEDHWIAEYWNSNDQRWVMVDAQLDQLQCQALRITFDPLDMQPGQFITGGHAWQMCRSGKADPAKFGIFNMHGLWFVRGNLVRDIASLNKMELLPWDCWGLSTGEDRDLSEDDFVLLDQAADLSQPDNFSLGDIHSIYENNRGLSVPPIISSYIEGEFVKVDLMDNCPEVAGKL